MICVFISNLEGRPALQIGDKLSPPPSFTSCSFSFSLSPEQQGFRKKIIKAKIAYIRFTVSAGVEVWSVTDDNLYVEG